MLLKRRNGKPKHSAYDQEYKASAVQAGLRLSVSVASRDLGIPRSTLRNWVINYKKKQNGQCISQKKPPDYTGNAITELTNKFKRIALKSSSRVLDILDTAPVTTNRGERLDYGLRELSTILGVSTDKLIALGGDSEELEDDRTFDVHITIEKTDEKS